MITPTSYPASRASRLVLLTASERPENVKPLSKSGPCALNRDQRGLFCVFLLCVFNVTNRSLDGVLTRTGHTLGCTDDVDGIGGPRWMSCTWAWPCSSS